MNLIIDKVMELEVVHITDCNRVIEPLTSSTVTHSCLTLVSNNAVLFEAFCKVNLAWIFRRRQFSCLRLFLYILINIKDVIFVSTVKDRRHNLPAKCLSGITEVNLKNLTDIHTRRNAQWVKNYIERSTVWEEWHIFNREYSGNNTLVTMTTSHFITNRNLSLLCDIASDNLIYTWLKLIFTIFSCEYLNIDNDTVFTMRNSKGSISDLTSLLTEDCSEKSFFCCKLCFTLWCNLTDKNIACVNLCTDMDNTTLVEVFKHIVADIRNISCNFLSTKLSITSFCFVFFYMN